jgi:hydrogenase maturation protein HypF
LLTERTIRLLQKNNYKVYWHQRIPPNDGGISLGQIAAYLMKHNHRQETEKENQLIKELS